MWRVGESRGGGGGERRGSIESERDRERLMENGGRGEK